MEFNRCSRCGSFYVSEGNVCPKCSTKDGYEFKTFTNYIKENGLDNSLDTISGETGIAVKNLNRFLGYLILFYKTLFTKGMINKWKMFLIFLNQEVI